MFKKPDMTGLIDRERMDNIDLFLLMKIDHDLNFDELANLCGVSRGTIQNMIKKREVPMKVLCRIESLMKKYK